MSALGLAARRVVVLCLRIAAAILSLVADWIDKSETKPPAGTAA